LSAKIDWRGGVAACRTAALITGGNPLIWHRTNRDSGPSAVVISQVAAGRRGWYER
jgi:hypothetical protein